MPIRFRCSQCDRLLGIARRKSGTQIRCPQCGEITTVPSEDALDAGGADRTLQGLDDLLGPAPSNNGSLLAPPESALVTIAASAVPRPKPVVEYAPVVEYFPPQPAAPKPAPKPKRAAPKQEDSLFEQDVDELLGLARPEETINLGEEPKVKPVNGMDAMSLDDGPGTITLSSQKATLIVVAAVILMLIAFVTGFAIRATI
jgi:phage FluMu protein Com